MSSFEMASATDAQDKPPVNLEDLAFAPYQGKGRLAREASPSVFEGQATAAGARDRAKTWRDCLLRHSPFELPLPDCAKVVIEWFRIMPHGLGKLVSSLS
jgi:hypothetical protein